MNCLTYALMCLILLGLSVAGVLSLDEPAPSRTWLAEGEQVTAWKTPRPIQRHRHRTLWHWITRRPAEVWTVEEAPPFPAVAPLWDECPAVQPLRGELPGDERDEQLEDDPTQDLDTGEEPAPAPAVGVATVPVPAADPDVMPPFVIQGTPTAEPVLFNADALSGNPDSGRWKTWKTGTWAALDTQFVDDPKPPTDATGEDKTWYLEVSA
jgi:hypothetical protein